MYNMSSERVDRGIERAKERERDRGLGDSYELVYSMLHYNIHRVYMKRVLRNYNCMSTS